MPLSGESVSSSALASSAGRSVAQRLPGSSWGTGPGSPPSTEAGSASACGLNWTTSCSVATWWSSAPAGAGAANHARADSPAATPATRRAEAPRRAPAPRTAPAHAATGRKPAGRASATLSNLLTAPAEIGPVGLSPPREASQAGERAGPGQLPPGLEPRRQRGRRDLDQRQAPAPTRSVETCRGGLDPLWEGGERLCLLDGDPPERDLIALVEAHSCFVVANHALTCCHHQQPQTGWQYAGALSHDHARAPETPQGNRKASRGGELLGQAQVAKGGASLQHQYHLRRPAVVAAHLLQAPAGERPSHRCGEVGCPRAVGDDPDCLVLAPRSPYRSQGCTGRRAGHRRVAPDDYHVARRHSSELTSRTGPG